MRAGWVRLSLDDSVTFSREAIWLLILAVAQQKPSRGGIRHPIPMQFYSGLLMHLLSGVDTPGSENHRAPDSGRKTACSPAATIPRTATFIRQRLCEEIKNFIQREAILAVDGQEILNYGRQSIPTFVPGHWLNSGPFGTMGVGLTFAVGAKAAKPSAQVVCLHGDGSFGQNAMELDTTVRHKLPLLCIISLNGDWTADPERNKPGRDLGYTRYDKMAEAWVNPPGPRGSWLRGARLRP